MVTGRGKGLVSKAEKILYRKEGAVHTGKGETALGGKREKREGSCGEDIAKPGGHRTPTTEEKSGGLNRRKMPR